MKRISAGEVQRQSISKKGPILVAYFSWSGNTREIAKQIHGIVGGDLFEIVSVDTYPIDYDECVKQARRELDQELVPKLRAEVDDIESYGLIFIGYPNWWSTIPRPVASFLSMCDSPNRPIVPFCTHEGSRLGRSVSDIAKLCPHSNIVDALAIRGGDARRAQHEISGWLRRIGMTD